MRYAGSKTPILSRQQRESAIALAAWAVRAARGGFV